ncbi:MAG: hypothetical protein WCJ46_06530 [bacterium]
MKRILLMIALLLISNALLALGEVTQTAGQISTDLDAEAFYASVTGTTEYKNKPVFLPIGAERNNLFEDVKVSIIEAIPFAFLYTALYLSIEKAIEQKKMLWEIKPGKLEDYRSNFITACAGFAAVNLLVNLTLYYDYTPGKKLEISLEPVKKGETP